jgi:hypothetical protein
MEQNQNTAKTIPSFLSAKTIGEALKHANISPKSSFNKYAVAAIAKTVPCLRKW